MRNAGLEEAQAGIKFAGRNINNLRYADDTTLMAESEEELKCLLMKVKEESKKVGLKLSIQKTKILASGTITSWEIDGKILQEMGIQNHLTSSWEICMQVKKQQLELDMEQQTGSKLGKEYVKVVYCHPAYLIYMQSTSWETWLEEAQAGNKIAGRNINNLRYADDTTLIAESEELKSLLMKVKEESQKVGLKLNI